MIPVSETWGYTLTQKPELRDKRDFMIYTHRLNFSMKFSYFLKMQIFYPDKTHYRLASIVKNHKKITRPDKAYKKLISFFKSQSIYLFFGTTCQELHIDKHLWEGESSTTVYGQSWWCKRANLIMFVVRGRWISWHAMQ